jgi:hypothetical protein
MRLARSLVGGAVVGLLVTAGTSREALADSPAAEALFQEGRRLLSEHKTDEACARLAESYAIEALSGTLLNLALCHETQGKIATAWAEYLGTARLARNQGRDDRARAADEKATRLEPQLPKVMVIARSEPGLSLFIDERSMGGGAFGAQIPVDPGTHTIKITRDGFRSWTTKIELHTGEQHDVEVPVFERVPEPASGNGESVRRTLEEPTSAPARVNLVSQPNAQRAPTIRARTWIAAGAATVAVGITVGFGISSLSSYHSADNSCPTHHNCSTQAISQRNTAETKAWIADAALGASLVTAGFAAYYWWQDRHPEQPESPMVSLSVTARDAAIGMAFTF